MVPASKSRTASRGIFPDFDPAVLIQLYIAKKNTIQIDLIFYKTINGHWHFPYREEESDHIFNDDGCIIFFPQYFNANAV